MNMHVEIKPQQEASNSHLLICAHELMVVALDIIDELGLPGGSGAHLDYSLQMLRRHMTPDLPPLRPMLV